MVVPVAPAQEQSPTPTPAASPTPAIPKQATEPLYTNYRGVSVGMSVAEAREKLGAPKSKGKQQDFFVFSKTESAQVVYLDGKVRTVSVDYVGADCECDNAKNPRTKPLTSGSVNIGWNYAGDADSPLRGDRKKSQIGIYSGSLFCSINCSRS